MSLTLAQLFVLLVSLRHAMNALYVNILLLALHAHKQYEINVTSMFMRLNFLATSECDCIGLNLANNTD